ncbi:SDR family oxidoreductase [Mangrovihabitans endophyticus]|uniref:NAD(P)-dependent oxidoreductase n=1 Tax=Mangrovihabitans endophyticus TaxID=1751298 RepID=A0A8J3C2E0_9ACTN|nr:SDR family oxidoreductase [Mangrovihabitans endophyticus]GGK99256.1 NAD(P)-dependent oxidoreductase [Mangrovihabitans endophyticus]
MLCLVSGATGYIGGRLAPRLLDAGHAVRCLSRSARRLRDVPWQDRVEVAEGDLSDAGSLTEAFRGVDVAYYLVHSLGQHGFEAKDRAAAHNFAAAARAAGVRRIVYLGGPEIPADEHPSAHLRSRSEVARILLDSGVPTVVLRAAIIIGSGSASFEMLRHLTERLPVMVTPRWVRNRIQPIAVRDVLRYLVAAAELPPGVNRGFDIGGADVLTYREMMQRYARVAGLRRRVIMPLRPLSPWLSAHWVGLVTPVPNSIARPLVGSLIHEAVAHEHDIAEYVPDEPADAASPDAASTGAASTGAASTGAASTGAASTGAPIGFDQAVRLALGKIRDANVETRWSTASGRDADAEPLPSDPDWTGGSIYVDERRQEVNAPVEALWRVIEGVGGENGWYSFPLAWSIRGWLDRLVGGVGLRRGRRDRQRLQVGEALDWWRVEEIRPGELLRLRAEMRVPGRAWLEMRAEPADDGPAGAGRSVYTQKAIFLPRGLAGHAYWASVLPFHGVVFRGMARNIARGAEPHPGHRRVPVGHG